MNGFRAFARLESSRRRLVVEAGGLLLIVAVGLRLARYTRLHRALAALASRTRKAGPSGPVRIDHAEVAWAIAAAGRRLPIAMTCLIEALASDTMLRRRCHASQLRFGVRRDRGEAPLAAHAWVECEGELVVGVMDDPDAYATLERIS